MRWVGLDAARGLLVLAATVTLVAAWAGASGLAPTVRAGLGLTDVVVAAFLVVAGIGIGWRRVHGDRVRPAPRARRRALLLTLAGGAVVVARSRWHLETVGPDELWRLAAATGLAGLLMRAPRLLVVALTPVLLAAPAVLAGGGLAGRGLRTLPREAAWSLEQLVGAPTGGLPLASLPAAVGLVLVGVAIGTWMARRPAGPASAGALLTVAVWAAGATLALGQLRAPWPVLLDLPVAVAAVATACVTVALGHLVIHLGPGTWLESVSVAVGRTAIVWVTGGAVLLAVVVRAVPSPGLPDAAAVTAGAVVAWLVATAARRAAERVERVAA